MQHVQISTYITDTSIKHSISGQSNSHGKGSNDIIMFDMVDTAVSY